MNVHYNEWMNETRKVNETLSLSLVLISSICPNVPEVSTREEQAYFISGMIQRNI